MSLFLNESDLNDFISPGESCIKPKTIVQSDGEFKVEIDQRKPVSEKIVLSDCLACSGCITSAESVLVSMQTADEFFRLVGDSARIVIVTLSPQARASFAEKYGWSLSTAHFFLERFFYSLNVAKVLDITYFRQLSLEQSCLEFDRIFSSGNNAPVISSSCPGWICFVEKTLPWLIDSVSKIKSPQAIAGTYIKRFMAAELNVDPSRIAHVSVMPCFDKKLEASRKQLKLENGRNETDLVVTPLELQDQFDQFVKQSGFMVPNIAEPVYADIGNSSGGSLAFIVRYMARKLLGIDLDCLDLDNISEEAAQFISINIDSRLGIKLVHLHDGSGTILLKAAFVYGFRSIQNLVRKLEPKFKPNLNNKRAVSSRRQLLRQQALRPVSTGADLADYHYIEVMACPRGCINGGGQIKPKDSSSGKQWIDGSELKYRSAFHKNLSVDSLVTKYRASLQSAPHLFATTFEPISKGESSAIPLTW